MVRARYSGLGCNGAASTCINTCNSTPVCCVKVPLYQSCRLCVILFLGRVGTASEPVLNDTGI